MKKNVMMRVASIMLVLVLMSSSVISGTFAKYVTSGEAGDSARVAKWGVTVTASSDIFADTYAADDTSFTLEANTVITSGAEAGIRDLVAPGTKMEDVATLVIAGIPEVAARVKYTADVTITGWTLADASFYCPLVFTLEDSDGNLVANFDGYNYASAAELESAIETFVAGYGRDYMALTNLENQPNTALALSWSWPFEVSDDRNVKDTYLGDQAAAGNHSTIVIDLDVTVTQID